MEKMNEQARQMSGLGRMIGKWAQGVALQGNMNKENGWVLSGNFRCFAFPVSNKKDVIQQTQFNLKARGAHKHGSIARVSSEANLRQVTLVFPMNHYGQLMKLPTGHWKHVTLQAETVKILGIEDNSVPLHFRNTTFCVLVSEGIEFDHFMHGNQQITDKLKVLNCASKKAALKLGRITQLAGDAYSRPLSQEGRH